MSRIVAGQNLCWVALIGLVLLLGTVPVGVADDAAPAEQSQRAEPRGRLPVYYNRVVTPDQREKVYEIQQRFQPKLDALLAQLAELEAQRDQEVEAVLSPDQLKRVQEFKKEADARRAAQRAETAAESSGQ